MVATLRIMCFCNLGAVVRSRALAGVAWTRAAALREGGQQLLI